MQYLYEITKEDYIEYCCHTHQQSPAMKRNLRLCRCLVQGIFVLAAIFMYVKMDPPLLVPVILYGGLGAVFHILMPASLKRSLRRNMVKAVNSGQGAEFLGPHVTEFTEDHFIYTRMGVETRSEYLQIERIEESENCLYLYLGSISAIIVPLRIFQNTSEKENLLHFLEEKAGKPLHTTANLSS